MTIPIGRILKQPPYLQDELDRQLIAILRADGRASISHLASQLKVSRGTIQNRMDRLISTGAILGFTVRTHQELSSGQVKAIMMIEVSGRSTTNIISQLKGFPQLERLHTTNGAWDLIAELRTQNLTEFDRILREVRETKGIQNSETSILLTTA